MSQSDIINSRQIQWFPGHMTKTLRLMEKEIRNVDLPTLGMPTTITRTAFCRSSTRVSRFPA